ncbi:hypothetical protein VNO80_30349 [Phaseolus coccineus]|uniref:Uncharacterized protein n=1 Tax=Phaseolus coccineus TaxID=3886 RepID=A0AAN9QFR8_PHACN
MARGAGLNTEVQNATNSIEGNGEGNKSIIISINNRLVTLVLYKTITFKQILRNAQRTFHSDQVSDPTPSNSDLFRSFSLCRSSPGKDLVFSLI